jgi:hypothetical protein
VQAPIGVCQWAGPVAGLALVTAVQRCARNGSGCRLGRLWHCCGEGCSGCSARWHRLRQKVTGGGSALGPAL